MKRIGLVGIVTNLSTKSYSHNAGWTYVTASILSDYFDQKVDIISTKKDNLNDFDVLIVNEGVNFKPGVFNFFGGAQENQKEALKSFASYKGQVLYLNDFVDYSIPCKKRKDLATLADLVFPQGDVLDLCKLSDSIIIGDSHSVSAFKPGRTILRLDGKTLNGALNIGLENLIPNGQKDVQFYFGNIDVRFHIKRFGGTKALMDLFQRYSDQVRDLLSKGYSVTLTHLIPIESESRKIPGTGKYKGENFFGSREERTNYVNLFNSLVDDLCNELNIRVEKWNKLNYTQLPFSDMEARQSVHLRPSSYMYIKEILR